MKIFLCRHGQTTGDLEHRWGGDYDDELTELGEYQARQLGKFLKDKKIEVVFHSPKKRAGKTAQILREELQVPLYVEDGLRETIKGFNEG